MRYVMAKRCGLDELNNFIMLIGFIFVVIALFTHKWLFVLIGAFFVTLCYLRVFSTKIDKRMRENDFYMRYMGKVVRFVDYIKLIIKMKIRSIRDKEYVYFVCSSCKQVIRVPKGKNKVSVRCPKCSATFVKRT
jgi:LSD1 subclass zinc finger protein